MYAKNKLLKNISEEGSITVGYDEQYTLLEKPFSTMEIMND